MEIPLFPLHTVLCPGHRPAAPHLRGPLPGADAPLPRHRRAVRRGPHPRGRRGRDRTPSARPRRGRCAGRDPRGRAIPGRPLRPPRGGHRSVRDPDGRSGPRAVPGRRRHAARGRGRRRGPGRTTVSVGDPPLRALSRADAGARRRDERGARHPGRGRQLRRRRDGARRRRRGRRRRRAGRARRSGRPRAPARRSEPPADRRRDLVIPDDPTVLSYLLSGIVQLELPRRQALLEAATTVIRLEALIRLLDREIALLGHRLRLFSPDQGRCEGPGGAEAEDPTR